MDSEDNNKPIMNNAIDKHQVGVDEEGWGEQNNIFTLIPGANKEMIDHFRGGSLDKMLPFKPVNLMQIMVDFNMDIAQVAVNAGTEPADVDSWFHSGHASEEALDNISRAVGVSTEWIRGFVSGEEDSLNANCDGLAKELQKLPDVEINTLLRSFRLKIETGNIVSSPVINFLHELNKKYEHSLVTPSWNGKTDAMHLIAIYRLMSESERRNLYRIVCLRYQELNAFINRHTQTI